MVSALPASPPAVPTRLQRPKKRPRMRVGIVRATRSVQAGNNSPPTTVITNSIASISHIESAGARVARKNATSARTRTGTRSQPVHRMMNGSFFGSRSVCAAVNSGGRNQPTVITAGMAPMSTVEAPSDSAKAGNTVAGAMNASPIMKRP